MKELLRFIETASCFDSSARIKLLLFASGVKPATYIRLRIKKNLHDKHRFEELLEKNNLFYAVGRAKGFEELVGVKKNAAVWRMNGTWYGYDLFQSENERELFDAYVKAVKSRRHAAADKIAGKLYGYPSCCVRKFIAEHDVKKLKGYTYYQYYERLHELEQRYPFVQHLPHNLACRYSAAMNTRYRNAIRRVAPAFTKKLARKKTYTVPLVVDTENDVKGVKWKKKDGHDYVLVTQKPLDKHHYLISWLTKDKYVRGTVLSGTVTVHYDWAVVTVNNVIGKLKNFHHERRFIT